MITVIGGGKVEHRVMVAEAPKYCCLSKGADVQDATIEPKLAHAIAALPDFNALDPSEHTWPIEEAIALRSAGTSMPEIADRLGTSISTLRRAFIARGIGAVRVPGTASWDIDKALALHADGLRISEIGTRFGMSSTSVRRAFRAIGIEAS